MWEIDTNKANDSDPNEESKRNIPLRINNLFRYPRQERPVKSSVDLTGLD